MSNLIGFSAPTRFQQRRTLVPSANKPGTDKDTKRDTKTRPATPRPGPRPSEKPCGDPFHSPCRY